MAYEDTITSRCAVDGVTVPGEISAELESDNQVIHATGKREPLQIVAGPASVSGSGDFLLGVGLEATLAKALSQTSGSVGQAHTITLDDTKKKYTGCQLTGLDISIPAHDVVTCSINWEGTGTDTSAAPAAHSISDFFVGTNVTLGNLPAVDFESCEISISSNVNAKHSARGASRLPVHLAQGYLDVSVDFTFLEDHGVDTIAASLSAIASATIVLTSQSGLKQLTITLTGLVPGTNSRNPSAEDIVTYGLDYQGTGIAFAESTVGG